MLRALVVCIVALAAAGCAAPEKVTVPAAVRAPPQTAHLGWEEPYPADGVALVFGASSVTVTDKGWSAVISIENRSPSGWEVGDLRSTAQRAFGVLLLPDDDLAALERRSRDGELPAIRAATSIVPPLPAVLEPGATWRGTISAPGALAGGLWLRLSYGPLTSVGKPPPGTVAQVVWFSDHAHQLRITPA